MFYEKSNSAYRIGRFVYLKGPKVNFYNLNGKIIERLFWKIYFDYAETED